VTCKGICSFIYSNLLMTNYKGGSDVDQLSCAKSDLDAGPGVSFGKIVH